MASAALSVAMAISVISALTLLVMYSADWYALSGGRLLSGTVWQPRGDGHTSPSSKGRRGGAGFKQQHDLDTREPQAHDGPACVDEVFAKTWPNGAPLPRGFASEAGWINSGVNCLELSYGIVDQDYLSQFKPRSRVLPPPEPPLTAFDFSGNASLPKGWPELDPSTCPHILGGFTGAGRTEIAPMKIYKGRLYIRPQEEQHPHWRGSRQTMLEMLLAVMWLYKDVPDMDFLLNWLDGPVNCSLAMPFLQYNVFNLTSPSTGERMDLDPNGYVCEDRGRVSDGCIGPGGAFAAPTYETWNTLATSPSALAFYSYCVHRRFLKAEQAAHGAGGLGMVDASCPARQRQGVAFWRGSCTGVTRGWSASLAASHNAKMTRAPAAGAEYLPFALLNKRLRLAMMGDLYPWLDVGTTGGEKTPDGWDASNGNVSAVVTALSHAVARDFAPLETWASRRLAILIDGHANAFRSSKLLLGTVPVVKVESQLQESFFHHFTPGQHYESVRYDLSDLAIRTRELLEDAAADDGAALDRMAAAALVRGTVVFHALAQTDSIAWALARMKEASGGWEVAPPEKEGGWTLVKLPRSRAWGTPFLRYPAVSASIRETLPDQFE